MTVSPEIFGRGTNRRSARRQLAGDQGRIAQHADVGGEVPAFLDQIDQAVVQAEGDRQIFVLPTELWETWSDLPYAKGHRCVYPQRSAHVEPVGAGLSFDLVDISQDALGAVEIAPPRLRGGPLARGPRKQFAPEPLLKSRHMLRGHRR